MSETAMGEYCIAPTKARVVIGYMGCKRRSGGGREGGNAEEERGGREVGKRWRSAEGRKEGGQR